jgi:DNA-binding GntR family transcriptional regulator
MSTNEPVLLPAAELLPDRSAPTPLYFQLAAGIERAILADRLPAGSRLENELSLSERLGLSRPTVRHAIQQLVEKGLLVRRARIGTQVVHGSVSRAIESTSLHQDLIRAGRTPSTRVLDVARVAAEGRIAAGLGVAEGTIVGRLRRLRLSDGVPLAVLDNVLAPNLLDVLDEDLEATSLSALLRARGVTMRVTRQLIGARRAAAGESRLLELEPGAPVLTAERTVFDDAGVAAEHGRHCYRPDRYDFSMTLVER